MTWKSSRGSAFGNTAIAWGDDKRYCYSWAFSCLLPSPGRCPAGSTAWSTSHMCSQSRGGDGWALGVWREGQRLGSAKAQLLLLPWTCDLHFEKCLCEHSGGTHSDLHCAWFPCLSFSLFEMKNKATCQSWWCAQTCNPRRFRKTSKWKLLGSDYISSQMANLCPEPPPLLWLLFSKLARRIHSGVICRLMR